MIKRIRALDARLVARKRLGAKCGESIALSTPGMLEANEALELVQIDHTLADVMIVDSVHRRSIGRPWLSLAIDVATRSVLGFHLGLEAPSALAVALCIEHAVLPKIRSAAAQGTEASWDMFGVPKTILVDNWSEFHGEALTRGCAEYGIALTYRPVARPRFGAHVERLIGTMMGRIHLLPGSTDSSPTARGNYQSENEAKLTLAELNEWLYLEIAGQYHHDIHRMIGTKPAGAWVKSLGRGTVPVLPADPARFVIGFLPIVHRKLQRNGLFFSSVFGTGPMCCSRSPSRVSPADALRPRATCRGSMFSPRPRATRRSLCRCPAPTDYRPTGKIRRKIGLSSGHVT